MHANRGSRQRSFLLQVLTLHLSVLSSSSAVAAAAVDTQPHTLAAYLDSIGKNPLAPAVTATIILAPNAAGWNNTSVRVHFAVTNRSSRVTSVTPDVILSNETADAEIDGIAFYNQGNSGTNHTTVVVRIDKTPPTLTLEPGTGLSFDDSYPLLVANYSDGGTGETPDTSGLNMASFQTSLDGIGATNLFYRFNKRAVAMVKHLAAGPHTWVVSIADMAGNMTIRSNTFTATGVENPRAPKISNLNLIDDLTITPNARLWMQGKVNGQEPTVSASVNCDTPIAMNRIGNDFGFYLDLGDAATNVIILVASDAERQNRSAQLAKVKVTDQFYVAITAPSIMHEFKRFTNGQSLPAKGTVSYRFAESETNDLALASVKVNGIAAILSGTVSNGQVGWDGVMLPAPGCTNSVMPIIVSVCWTGRTSSSDYTNLCLNVPLDFLEGFEIVQRKSNYAESWLAGEYPSQTFEQGNSCGPNRWIRGDCTFACDNEFNLPCSEAGNSVSTCFKSDWTWTCIKQEPDFEEATYGRDLQGEDVERLPASNRGLSFGNWGWKTKYTRQAMGDGVLYLDGFQVAEDGLLTFRTPFYLEPQYANIFTFFGVEGVALSNLMWEGHAPLAYDYAKGTVSYFSTLDGGTEYTISQDSFQWPSSATNSSATYEADDTSSNGRHLEWHSESFHRFSFSDFEQ
jgi:hypothetical protein